MIRDGFKNANKRTRGGDPFREDCSELVLQPILQSVTQGITLGHAFPRQLPPACWQTSAHLFLCQDHTGGGRQRTPSTAIAKGLGLCCTSHLNLMLKMFKSHCQVHVKLPPHIRSVQQVPKRPNLVSPC